MVSFQESMYIDRERHLDRKLASYLASTRSLYDREIADRVTVLLSTDWPRFIFPSKKNLPTE